MSRLSRVNALTQSQQKFIINNKNIRHWAEKVQGIREEVRNWSLVSRRRRRGNVKTPRGEKRKVLILWCGFCLEIIRSGLMEQRRGESEDLFFFLNSLFLITS